VGFKFKPFRARWVASERWHPEQVGQYLPCGSYQFDVPYSEVWELIQSILKQSPDVDLLAPLALREKVAGLIDSMRLSYRL
jgi:predicted DNA-binding transcriptional regulator YafY